MRRIQVYTPEFQEISPWPKNISVHEFMTGKAVITQTPSTKAKPDSFPIFESQVPTMSVAVAPKACARSKESFLNLLIRTNAKDAKPQSCQRP
jgi:hypothetical protein